MKKKPRPVIEWLNELPELIRELVIADYDGDGSLASSMSQAIRLSCFWMLAEIGPTFYECLYSDALYHEQNNLKI